MKSRPVAAEVHDRVVASRERFWRPEDFRGAPLTVAKALSRLEKAGELRRIRRGLYWRGAVTPLGMAPPPTMRLAKELVGVRGVGPGEGSAALALGLSTHVPAATTIAVPGRVPDSPFDTVRFVSRSASTKRLDERLRPGEVALLEVLRDWDRYVDAPEAVAYDRIGRLIEDGTIRLERVVAASVTEPARTRSRLRAVLEALGFTDAAHRVPPPRFVKYSESRVA
ncbi:MAG: hypothetical protein GXP34_09950 [Actinobacteria bacterium]|nr:hypothetical protein [Actinomycetota bacterium]